MENKSYKIDVIKLLLLLGVVSIHSNVLATSEVDYLPSLGSETVLFFSSTLTRICVPAFFIISGFLFFLNVDNFTFNTYKSKLSRRFFTLFIPYILWNLISLFLQIIKIKYLGFPDYGLFENGNLQWTKVFEGFYNYVDGYPFAFAFWFIRNLMIFILLSPLAYILACEKLSIGTIFIIMCCALNTTFFGFCFFVFGGIISRYFKTQFFQLPIYLSLASGIIWVSISVINLYIQFDFLSSAILIIESIAALAFITFMIQFLINSKGIKIIIKHLVPSTFFIYSFHQLCCTVIRNFFIDLFGLTTSIGIILSYLFSFITLVGLSYAIWATLKWIRPSLLNILCGSRGLHSKSLSHKRVIGG